MTQDQQISMVVFGGLVAIASVAWLVTSLVLLLRFWRTRGLVRTSGRVVRHQQRVVWLSSASGGHTETVLLAAVVSFVGPDGIGRSVEAQVSSNIPPPIGSALVVAFPPGQPEAAVVDSALARYFAPTVVWMVLTLVIPLLARVGLSAIQR